MDKTDIADLVLPRAYRDIEEGSAESKLVAEILSRFGKQADNLVSMFTLLAGLHARPKKFVEEITGETLDHLFRNGAIPAEAEADAEIGDAKELSSDDCPVCHSDDIAEGDFERGMGSGGLLLECYNCHAEWWESYDKSDFTVLSQPAETEAAAD